MSDSRSTAYDDEMYENARVASELRLEKARETMQMLLSKLTDTEDHEKSILEIRDLLNTEYPPDHFSVVELLNMRFPVSKWASRGASYKHEQDPITQKFRYGALEFKFEKR